MLQEEELDRLCEEFLVKDFDHRIDFQVEDSLPRLERWGLVTRTEQVCRSGGSCRLRFSACLCTRHFNYIPGLPCAKLAVPLAPPRLAPCRANPPPSPCPLPPTPYPLP